MIITALFRNDSRPSDGYDRPALVFTFCLRVYVAYLPGETVPLEFPANIASC